MCRLAPVLDCIGAERMSHIIDSVKSWHYTHRMAAVSAHAVANAFLDLAEQEGRSLTNMQVQKLVFLAHGYMLAIYDRPLYYDNTHAWQWGPVVPRLYKAMQRFGSGFVSDRLTSKDASKDAIDDSDADAKAVVHAVWQGYGHRSGGELSSITHKSGSPWSKTWERKKFDVIPTEDIAAYYRALVEVA